MSVPINAYATRFLRGKPKYVKRANRLARKRGFANATHQLVFLQMLAMNRAQAKFERIVNA